MPTLQVGPGSTQELQMIADVLGKSRKVVVVTGAGISTNCGIPDFRSENGLYSLIQSQYDAALKNPPWEHTNTFDIDDRPKKKRKQWFYEVVAPDGTVVDVIDEDLAAKEAQPEPLLRRNSRSKSSDSTTSNSRSSTPGDKSSDSSLSSCPSLLSDPIDAETFESTPTSQSQLFCPPQIESTFLQKHQISSDLDPPRRRSSLCSSPQFDQESTITAIPLANSAESTRPPSPTASLTRKTRTPLPTSALGDTSSSSSHFIPETTPKPRVSTLQQSDSSFISTTTDSEEVPATQSSQTSSRSLPNLKGRDLFDCMVWNDPFTTSIFYMFISSLRQKVKEVKQTSETHKFIRVLRDGGRLVRTYTQNIDLLETREGLSTELSLGPGNRGRFGSRTQRERCPKIIDRHSTFFRGVECVLLHGSLVQLRCGLCASVCDWDEAERFGATLAGSAPDCPACSAYNSRRTSANRRGLAIGRLRPDIVLYGEEHPNANLISPLITHDLSLGPDVMLIMGTSLKVHGLKVMIREFAKAVHNKGGKVVFVNRTKPSESVWGDVIDYWVAWDCDEWVLDLKERRSDIWLPQGATKEEEKRRESMGNTKPLQKTSRAQCLRDDKINGAFMTFKIMDTLNNLPDAEGRPSSRIPYWPSALRQSNVQAAGAQPEKKSEPSKKTSKATANSKAKLALEKEKANTKKRKSHPVYNESYLDDKENPTYKVAEMWARMREENPNLAAIPLELKLPFSHLSGNMPEFYKRSFPFDGQSNHLPNVVGISSLAGMNLGSLPPSGTTVYQAKPTPKPIINHSYGTRASRRWSAPDEIIADKNKSPFTPLKLSETSHPIDVNDPMTPSSQRIKRISSIGNVVSSPEDEVEIWHDASEVLT